MAVVLALIECARWALASPKRRPAWALLPFFLSGCDQLLGLDSFGPADAGRDVGAPAAQCGEVGYPPRPASSGDEGSIEFFAVQRSVPIPEWPSEPTHPGYELVGFNLDRRCTGAGDGPSCVSNSSDPALQKDGVAGRDNAGARLLSKFGIASAFSARVTAGENSGELNAMYRVRGYNGLPDDAHVRVDYLGVTLRSPSHPDSPVIPPSWNGNDEWRAVTNWLLPQTGPGGEVTYSPEHPLFSDTDAYVSGRRLVVRFDRLLVGGSVPQHEVVLTGNLVNDGGSWRIEDGVGGAHWEIGEALPELLTFVLDANCKLPIGFTAESASTALCSFADLRSAGDDPSLPCNALSWGFLFTAVPARLNPNEVVPPETRCTPDIGPIVCAPVDGGIAP